MRRATRPQKCEGYALCFSRLLLLPYCCQQLHSQVMAFEHDLRLTCKTRVLRSGAEGIRTPDLRRAKAALSQLSYGPERGWWREFTAVAGGGLMDSRLADAPGRLLAGDESVRGSVAAGLDSMAMCDMNRVAGAHASPFPFPILPLKGGHRLPCARAAYHLRPSIPSLFQES
jgi:hypothetical protein